MNAKMIIWMIVLVLLAALAVVLLAVDFYLRWIEKKEDDKRKATAEKAPQKRKFRAPEANVGESWQLAEPPKVEIRKTHTVASGFFDLMGAPRPMYTVVLPPDGVMLTIPMPTKALADRFGQIGKTISALKAGKGGMEAVEELFMLTALVLANNREGIVVTTAYVAERLSSDETVQLLTDYMRWIREQLNEKN